MSAMRRVSQVGNGGGAVRGIGRRMNSELDIMREVRQRIAAAPKDPPTLLGILFVKTGLYDAPSMDGERVYRMYTATLILDTDDPAAAETAAKSLPVMSELAARLGVDDVRRVECEVAEVGTAVAVKVGGWVEHATKGGGE